MIKTSALFGVNMKIIVLLPVVSSGWLDWWEMDWETFQSEVWTADCLQFHWLWTQFECQHLFKQKGLCLETNIYLNWWRMEIYSCETSPHLWENHDPAERGGGRTKQTLTLCILQKEKRSRHSLVSVTVMTGVQTNKKQDLF